MPEDKEGRLQLIEDHLSVTSSRGFRYCHFMRADYVQWLLAEARRSRMALKRIATATHRESREKLIEVATKALEGSA